MSTKPIFFIFCSLWVIVILLGLLLLFYVFVGTIKAYKRKAHAKLSFMKYFVFANLMLGLHYVQWIILSYDEVTI